MMDFVVELLVSNSFNAFRLDAIATVDSAIWETDLPPEIRRDPFLPLPNFRLERFE